MRMIFSVIAVFALSVAGAGQSGRRAGASVANSPPPAREEATPNSRPKTEEAPAVTAERNQDYSCTEDGSLARILVAEGSEEPVLSSKKVDSRVSFTAKPQPSYTKEARRAGVQGFVVLKTLMSADAKISRVRVVKGLPAGLTESAIRAACKIKFKPAIKDGQPVAQWLTVEYVFRLADSSIFGP